MSGFQVGIGALAAPAQRLQQISADLTTAATGAGTAAGTAAGVGGAAGDPRVAAAAEVFQAGVKAVLGALGEDAGMLADKVQQAGVTYETVDRTAVPGP